MENEYGYCRPIEELRRLYVRARDGEMIPLTTHEIEALIQDDIMRRSEEARGCTWPAAQYERNIRLVREFYLRSK